MSDRLAQIKERRKYGWVVDRDDYPYVDYAQRKADEDWLIAEVEKLREVVRLLDSKNGYCPVCRRPTRNTGHTIECPVGQALKERDHDK